MSFRYILHELLATTAGAVAVIFLDFEGETVDLVCDHDLSDHDLRVIGAYQGLFRNRIRELCEKTKIGTPLRFKFEFSDRTSVLSFDVKDGYYLVMLLDARADEGAAWRKMELCQQKVLAEM